MMPDVLTIEGKASLLVDHLRSYDSCAVAYSGGVDSAVVAAAAYRALGERSVAVTANSASLAARDLEVAIWVAQSIGIRHEVIETSEFDVPEYRRNGADRCYFCKRELYSTMRLIRDHRDEEVLINGTNADDADDYRPGLLAADQADVVSPLADLGFDKSSVRQIARRWELAVSDRPASPCLASRVAYGTEVTPQRVARIEQAEQRLQDAGFDVVRVRVYADEVAKIEVAPERVQELREHAELSQIVEQLRSLGFQDVSIDERGFKSGRHNEVLKRDIPFVRRNA